MTTETVATMARENSGIDAKLRTYLQGATSILPTRINTVGGATLDMSDPIMAETTHTSGYYVGGGMPVHTFGKRSDVRKYQKAMADAYTRSEGKGLFGVWLSEDRETVNADLVTYFPKGSLLDALKLAESRGERFIYSIGRQQDIPVRSY